MGETGRAPDVRETAAALDRSIDEVEAAYRQLHADHVMVLKPESLDIWMAMPFSNVPTPFRVIAGEREYFANCAWDAFGIPAALESDARILTRCGDSGEAMEIEIAGGNLRAASGIAHFALPAARWWADIGYT
jgi:DNA-binding transcriptional MocR family regulator